MFRLAIHKFFADVRQENEEWIARYDSDDEGREFEGFHASDTYTTPEFLNWSKTFSDNSHSLHEFNELVGPIRVFDGSATPLEYFQLSYSDVVFGKNADLQTHSLSSEPIQ